MPAAPVVLRTERLLLRPMEEGDIAFTVAALGDLEVSRHLAFVPHPYAESDARWWLDETRRTRADGSMDHFMIEPIEGGTPIGAIGLSAAPERSAAEVGYWIARGRWGRGYAREALAAVVRFAFHGRIPAIEVLSAHAHRSNPASMRVLESCGFVEVGSKESRSAATGESHDSAVFELRRG